MTSPKYFEQDLAAATENILLEAEELGTGSGLDGDRSPGGENAEGFRGFESSRKYSSLCSDRSGISGRNKESGRSV